MTIPSASPAPRSYTYEYATLFALIAVNVGIFAMLASSSGSQQISSRVLYDAGAVYGQVFEKGEYWRLINAGFLHLDGKHLLFNMLSLYIFGEPVIRRTGIFTFLIIYLVSVIGGNVLSIMLHQGPFLSAGASGGITGLLGALLFLWAFAGLHVQPQFLFGNIVLNIAYSSSTANIDWMSHLGGFMGGFLACAVFSVLRSTKQQNAGEA